MKMVCCGPFLFTFPPPFSYDFFFLFSGDWHKGVDVFVLSRINGKTMMVIQKRSSLKKIAPSCWDLSCAEHLGIGK